MIGRFHKCSAVVLLWAAGESWGVNSTGGADHLLGACFASEALVLKEFDLPGGVKDKNVVLKRVPSASGAVFVVDESSAGNQRWYLLERVGAKRCVPLAIPSASEVYFSRLDGVRSIVARTQSPPGFPSRETYFRKSVELKRWVPYRCQEFSYPEGGVDPQVNPVDCLDINE